MGCFPCWGKVDPVSENTDRRKKKKKKKKKKKSDDRVASGKLNPSGSLKQLHPQKEVVKLHTKEEVPKDKGKSSELGDICKDGKTIGLQAQTFTFDELVAATGNFRANCFLGEGGFGKVYKGHLERINQVVAIKQLDRNGPQGTNEFVVEVETLSRVNHPNLVKLYGFCDERDQRLLVYEYMPLGSLESHLHDLPRSRKGLDWNTRMKIAAGAAKGLEYLHVKLQPPIIYRDLKCSNILLGEGYHTKLSDFGLAKVGPSGDSTHVSTRVMGTYGYCAPDYAMTGQLTLRSDIYSFGVVLLELITGRKAYDPVKEPKEQYIVAWARPLFKDRKKFTAMVDPKLDGQYPVKGLYQALAIAAMCVQEQPSMRPVISDVVAAFDYLVSQDNNLTTTSRSRSPESAMQP